MSKWHFDEERANHAVNWIEDFCTYPDGEKAGEPLEMLPYFREITREAFGWVDQEGNLKYNVVYCEVPRGNAKSTNGSAIALYLTFGFKEKSREIYCCAGTRDQAGKVFEPARMMVYNDPVLSDMAKVQESYKKIIDKETFSFLKATAAEGCRQHGHKTNGCIFDEVHVQPNSNLWDAMRTSMTKKKNPMLWAFTTAGVTGTFAEEIHQYAKKVRDGLIEDERWLVRIYSADEDADPFEPKTWEEANPAWEIMNKDAFRASAREAENSPLFLNTFKRYHLNIWTGAETAFLSIHDWDNCRDTLTLEDFKGKKCYYGIDYGATRDLTAVAKFFPIQEGVDRPTCFVQFFCPEETVYDREKSENVNYEVWVNKGLVMATPGNFVDKDTLREWVIQDALQYDWVCMGIDQAKMDTLRAQWLHHYNDIENQEKIRVTRQGEWLTDAIEQLERWVVAGELCHDGNAVMRWMCDNMAVQESKTSSRKRIIKTGRKNRIDGFAALLNAIYEWIADERKQETALSDFYTTAI